MNRIYVHNNTLRSENISLGKKFKIRETSTPILITKYFTSFVSENCWKILHVRKDRLSWSGLRDLVRWKTCFLDSGRFV